MKEVCTDALTKSEAFQAGQSKASTDFAQIWLEAQTYRPQCSMLDGLLQACVNGMQHCRPSNMLHYCLYVCASSQI